MRRWDDSSERGQPSDTRTPGNRSNSDSSGDEVNTIEFNPTKGSNNIPAAFDFLGSLPGPANEAIGVVNIRECFHLFLPKEFYEVLLQQTNLYAEQTRANEHNTCPWTPVSYEELMAFIGLVIAMGVISLPSYQDYWSKDPITAHYWFRRVMSRN